MMNSGDNWLEKEPEFVTPTKVIPVWSDTVLHQAGKAGTRGFGGRVMFYAGDGKRAVRVDGSLVVYAWDDSKSKKERQPDRKFVFPMEDLQQHYSGSTIGDSYSFWIPWDAAGGQRKELTLVVRFVGRNGAEVTSTPAKAILPGVVSLPKDRVAESTESASSATKSSLAKAESPSAIQQASFRSTEDPAATKHKRLPEYARSMNTTEIAVTSGFLRRNMQGSPPAVFSPEDLFTGAPQVEQANAASSVSVTSNALQSALALTSDATDQDDAASQNLEQPSGRSLRFRDRVRNSREAQRSVGRALSERYQSGSRLAPWEKD